MSEPPSPRAPKSTQKNLTVLEGIPPKPPFIPLKRAFFEAFKKGTKTTEYRLLGPRWNMLVCPPRRRVVLSLGYGKAQRLSGVVESTYIDWATRKIPGWLECYPNATDPAYCIVIKLDPNQ